jgi:transcriptional regulator with XRE-family HTH domain
MKKLSSANAYANNLQVKAGKPTNRHGLPNNSILVFSVQTANNWLLGHAIPSQEKLRVLAAWLETSAEWLRNGDAEMPPIVEFQGQHYGLSDLPEKLEKLSPKQKRVIYDVIDAMLQGTNTSSRN